MEGYQWLPCGSLPYLFAAALKVNGRTTDTGSTTCRGSVTIAWLWLAGLVLCRGIAPPPFWCAFPLFLSVLASGRQGRAGFQAGSSRELLQPRAGSSGVEEEVRMCIHARTQRQCLWAWSMGPWAIARPFVRHAWAPLQVAPRPQDPTL